MNVVLTCNGGFSTSLLAQRMKTYAEKQGDEIFVKAVGFQNLDKNLKGVDLVLVGPQIKNVIHKIETMTQPLGIPVALISMKDYGTVNGEAVYNQVLTIIGQKEKKHEIWQTFEQNRKADATH